AGKDVSHAGADNDVVDGGSGNDRLYGEGGDDIITGGSGNDVLVGGDGGDKLTGGSGNDVITGGEGDDTAYWSGSLEQYTFSNGANGSLIVRHVSGSDGTDTVSQVDTLVFGESGISFEQAKSLVGVNPANYDLVV